MPNANAILASSRRYDEPEKTWKIPKMDEPGPGSYQVEEAIKKSQWAKIKGHARMKVHPEEKYELGTWIDPPAYSKREPHPHPYPEERRLISDVRTRRLVQIEPNPDC